MNNESSPESPILKGANAWDTADAPDKFFAYVPDSAKGADGNKSDRKFPLASVEKKDLDEAIIQNAAARLSQANLPSSAIADVKAKIASAARAVGANIPSLGVVQKGEGLNGGTNMPSEQKPEDIAKLEAATAEIVALKGELAKRDQKIELLERAKPRDALNTEVEKLTREVNELREFRAAAINDKIMEKVNLLTKLRYEAGLIANDADRAKDVEKLKVLPPEALDSMIEDFEVISASAQHGGNPKTKFNFRGAAHESVEDVYRANMHLPRKEKKEAS